MPDDFWIYGTVVIFGAFAAVVVIVAFFVVTIALFCNWIIYL